MKNPDEFIRKMNQELKDTPPPKGSTQEEFMQGLINAAEEEKRLKREKENTVEYSEDPKDMEEIFEGVSPENENEKETGSTSLVEEEDNSNGKDEKNDIDRSIPPAPLRKRGRPKKVAQVEEVVKEWDKEDLEDNANYIESSKNRVEEIISNKKDEEAIREWDNHDNGEPELTEYRKGVDERVTQKINESKEKEEIENERFESGAASRIEEIKSVINKELGGEPEVPKTPDERLDFKKKELEEIRGTLKELEGEISIREVEYKELFLSDQVMRNLLNKWWFESDTEKKLKVEIESIRKEVMVAEEVKKELELEIKRINKEIQERDFEEGRKKSKGKEALKSDLGEDAAKKELEILQYESKKDDLAKIEKEILKIEKKNNSAKWDTKKDKLLAEKDELETEIMTYELNNSNNHELLEKKEDEILGEIEVFKINEGKIKSGEMDKDEYNRKMKVLEDRLSIIGKIKEEMYKKAGVL